MTCFPVALLIIMEELKLPLRNSTNYKH